MWQLCWRSTPCWPHRSQLAVVELLLDSGAFFRIDVTVDHDDFVGPRFVLYELEEIVSLCAL